MVRLLRCKICGQPYIGVTPPNRCPFCGAYEQFILEAKDYMETFDVGLSENDAENVRKALQLEISNAEFYFCASEKTDSEEGKQLFKALGKVENEHASIWRKVLKLPQEETLSSEECSTSNKKNLQESYERESAAIKFYSKAAVQSGNIRVRQIFGALIQVETDHLQLSTEMLKK